MKTPSPAAAYIRMWVLLILGAAAWVGGLELFAVCFLLAAGVQAWSAYTRSRTRERVSRLLEDGPSRG